MNEQPIGRLAAVLLCVCFVGPANAECLSADNLSSACRYPAGDAWCARHGNGNLYAYRDNCTTQGDRAETPAAARPPAATGSWSPVAEWDCSKARSGVERLICANPDIRAQDSRMGNLYARLQARGQAPERAQKAWLLDRRNACSDADCLRAVYADRIRDLEGLAGIAGAPVEERSFATAPPPAAPAPARATPPSPEPTAEPAAPEPVADSSPEPIPQTAPTPLSETFAQKPETGIPELPPPEGPTLESRRREAGGSGYASDRQGGTPPARGSGLVSASVAALALAIGLILWRRRARIGAALESYRRRSERLGQRIRTVPSAGLARLRDLRPRAPTSARSSTPAPKAAPASAPSPAEIPLPEDAALRLRALARPGEPLSSVLARAVAALEAAPASPPPEAVLSRLAALEARLAQLEGTEART